MFAAPSPKAFIRKIYAQWTELGRLSALKNPTDEGLRRFVKNHVGVDKPEWLTYEKAVPVINALKAWIASGKFKGRDFLVTFFCDCRCFEFFDKDGCFE